MNINRVGNGIAPLSEYSQQAQNNKKIAPDQKNVSDKIEISQEAKVKKSETSDSNKLALVKERIDSGFYNKPDVISKVADSILKELRGA